MKNAAGETLIEALAAILIFTFGSIVMLTLFTGTNRLNEAAGAERQALTETQLLRELGQSPTEGTVVFRLGRREESIPVIFSGVDDAVFVSAEDWP